MPILVYLGRTWDEKVWYISWLCYSLGRLVFLSTFWYIFPRFGSLNKEKSGNPDRR
jgi:hypothetical protein